MTTPTLDDAQLAAARDLTRAIYFLDRELAPGNKVRAFQKARNVVLDLRTGELAERVADNSI